jgi:octaprenyl-diphosphate synthase
LLSKGLLLSVEHEDFDLLKSVSTAVREMAEGELLQIEKARKLDITEDVYFDIITKKTATLIAACCAVGFQSAGAEKELVEKARLFGEKVGIAFQIKDDLFDYGDAEIGKPLGIDIKEKKMTLPLIYALQNTDNSTKKHIIQLIKKESEDSNKVREVIDFVKSTGGLSYANKKMNEVAEEARAILATFPASDYRNSLGDLISYTIERNK